MNFLLITLGSTGDIRPFITLGRELQESNHRCTIASQVAFAEAIQEAGLQFYPLIESEELNRLDSMMLEIFVKGTGPRIVDYFYNLILGEFRQKQEPFLQEVDNADCVVASYLFPFFALFAEKRGVPSCTLSLSHRFYPSKNHNPLIEKRTKLPFNPLSWGFFFWFIHRKLRSHLRRHGLLDLLPESYSLRDFYTNRTYLGVPTLFEDNLDPRDRQGQFCGAIRSSGTGEVIPQDVDQFLGTSRVPLLNFGSVTFTGVEKVLQSFLFHWPKDRKILVQSGWAGLKSSRAPQNIKFADMLPHQSLLPRISCLIHHGGAGTTAAALHAGVPQIIIPHIADQWFFAGEIERLGLGRKLTRRGWPRKLPELVVELESSPHFREKAKIAADRLQKDRGAHYLASRLEEFAESHRL